MLLGYWFLFQDPGICFDFEFQIYAEEGMVFRVLLLCIGLGISLTFLFLSPAGRNFITYFKDSIQEAKRVVWPTKETFQTVVMVFYLFYFLRFFCG